MLIIWQHRFIQKAFLYLCLLDKVLFCMKYFIEKLSVKRRGSHWDGFICCDLHQVYLLCWDVWNQQADAPVGFTNWFSVWTSYQQAVILLLVLQNVYSGSSAWLSRHWVSFVFITGFKIILFFLLWFVVFEILFLNAALIVMLSLLRPFLFVYF